MTIVTRSPGPEASAVLGSGFSLALFALLELFPQIPGLVRAALVLVGLGLAVSAGQRLALGQLLLALAALELLQVRVVGGHTQTLIECAGLPGCDPSQESPRLKNLPKILACVVLTVALAGCGGSSAPSLSAFKSAFTTDHAQFHQLSVDLQRELTGARAKTDAQLAIQIGALSTRAKHQASDLAELKPPGKYKPDVQKLISGFTGLGADLEQISVAATKRDAASATAATRLLIRDAATIRAADDALSSALKLR